MKSDKPTLYCATTNAGKLREFRNATDQWNIEPLPGLKQIAPPEEIGVTFEENAILKALYYSAFTPELMFAEDSGLEVVALQGAPGVYSARFAGPDATDAENNRLLLERLAGIADRRARFVCVIALAQQGRAMGVYYCTLEGEILHEERGQNGFGYDPLFYFELLGCTFAEASLEQKLAVSHRGEAARLMLEFLRNRQ